MAKDRMDVMELLRKRGLEGDVDFLREALRVLVDGIMDAEVSAQIGTGYGNGVLTGLLIAMIIAPGPGTPGWAPWTCIPRRSG